MPAARWHWPASWVEMASAVSDSTDSILLESAWFKPATIMGKARALGLHTDASHRFERGVDPQAQVQALEHATALILDVCGGVPGPVLLAEEPQWLPANGAIRLRHDRLNRVVGLEFEQAGVEKILTDLGMSVAFADGCLDGHRAFRAHGYHHRRRPDRGSGPYSWL